MIRSFGRTTRRQFLVTGVAAGAGVGMPFVRRALAATNWRKFDGTSIEVSMIKSPRGDIIQKNLKAFEDLTGIEVGLEQVPEQQQRQKSVVEFSSGRPSFDVCHLSYHVQKRLFEKGRWLADLKPFLDDPELRDPNLDPEDFSAAGKAYATNEQGELRSLPISVDYWIIYWNKDLFQKAGLEFPQTFDALIAAAEKLTDPATGTYGFVARGMKNANLPVWASFLLGYGVEPVGPGLQLNTTSEGALAATRMYQHLLTKTAPPGTIGFNWNECQAAFLQGKAAMWLDGVGFAPPLEDPTKSRVVGKVGYAVMPKGPQAHASATFGDGLGIADASQNKEAAFLFLQWALSKPLQAQLLQTGSGVPFRKSVLADQTVRQGVKMPAAWVDSVIGSAEVSKFGLPVVVPVTEFRDIFGIALTNTLSGADPKDELQKATDQFRPILEKSEA
ncbi:carbohydrate ABC transporter substrate-binding protein, CUT1 family [Arboricoccus pini]|uniref:Carbohydrate ABC transporter substrate-binding protein, CUT1 family n=1 Tax=Arboricoccus pini TaxID=1963835 RepID=A0A212RCR2_9PROT|nr:sugar ABC transporter substrate-binding protein [Arboricoccus pini]SNB70036.1 carbohydrate ABC transporter substrate-binding protein, CUT1 family [Arboricoccus pini]